MGEQIDRAHTYTMCVCVLFFRMIAFILPPVPGPKIKGIDTHLLEVRTTSNKKIIHNYFSKLFTSKHNYHNKV